MTDPVKICEEYLLISGPFLAKVTVLILTNKLKSMDMLNDHFSWGSGAGELYFFVKWPFPALGIAISWMLVRLHLMGLAWVFSQLTFWLKWKLCWNWNQTFTDESFQRYQCFCFVIILSKRTRLWDLVNRWFHHVSPPVAAEDGPGQCERTFLSRSG